MRKTIVFACLIFSALSVVAQKPQFLVPFQQGNKWGYSDTLGKLMIKPKYDQALFYDYGELIRGNRIYAITGIKDTMIVIDEKGKQVLAGRCKSIYIVYLKNKEYFIVTNRQNKMGVFSLKGEIIPAVYDNIVDNRVSSFFHATKDDQTFYFDPSGKRIAYKEESLKLQHVTSSQSEEAPMAVSKEEARSSVDQSFLRKLNADSLKNIDNLTTGGYATLFYKGDKWAVVFPRDPDSTTIWNSSKYKLLSVIRLIKHAGKNIYHKKTLLILDSAGKQGLMQLGVGLHLGFTNESIRFNSDYRIFQLKNENKYGFFRVASAHPAVSPRYDALLQPKLLTVSSRHEFLVYKVRKGGKDIWVGENGVEFFSDK